MKTVKFLKVWWEDFFWFYYLPKSLKEFLKERERKNKGK